jgi:cation-transporting ATPase I
MRLPVVGDPTAPAREVLRWLGNAEGRRRRRITRTGGRFHVEVRGVHDPDRPEVAGALKTALERLDGVNWAEVTAVVGRAVILCDPEAIELDDVLDVIEDVEDAHDLSAERFPHDRPDHPADVEPVHRQLYGLVADAAGFGLATAGQLLHLARIPAEIPGIVSLAENQPRLRRLMEDRLGPPATDVVLGTTNAVVQALGHGPAGLLVDMADRGMKAAEQQSRRQAWERREPELVTGPHSVRHRPLELPAREVPLPKGPVERYVDLAAAGSLGLVGATLATTLNARRAVDQILTGVPKAALHGREAFAAVLDVVLSRRGVLVMDPAALRRLDRVTTLVVDARLLSSGRWVIDDVERVAGELDEEECAGRARSLFDPDEPTGEHERKGWRLGPWNGHHEHPPGSSALADRLGSGGRRVLGLWHDDRLAAFVASVEDPARSAMSLVREAHRSGLEVVLAGGSQALAERLGADGRWDGADVAAAIRRHQADGRVVMYASGRAHTGLRAADVGIGVESPGRRVPFGAHIVIRQGLGEGWLLLAAVRAARDVSTRSAVLAGTGTAGGAAWGFMGPPRAAASRTMLGINISAMASMANGAVAGLRAGSTPVPVPSPLYRWHELKRKRVLHLVGSRRQGLDEAERLRRLRLDRQEAATPQVDLVRALVEELANPLTPVLALGAALSAAVGSVTDAGLVIGVVGANALVGGVQRVQTERALRQLDARGRSPVQVLVAGEPVTVPADQLVVGDVIRLEAGEPVPTDCRVLRATNLEVDESSLTGESLPVDKARRRAPGARLPERTSMLYQGTVIAAGSAEAVVVAVGGATEARRSAAAAGEPPPSGVEQRLGGITRLTVPVTVGAGVVAAGMGLAARRPLRDAVGTGVSLTVAAVPEGLPALATVAQVAAARRLADRNALVRNPRAIEALGRVDQVCFDKTGTLTEGTLAVVLVSDGDEERRPEALDEARRAVLREARRATPGAAADGGDGGSNGNGGFAHATDAAVAITVEEHGVGVGDRWEVIDDLPFESRRGMHAVLGIAENGGRVAVKGAPEVVLPRCRWWRRGDDETEVVDEVRRGLERHVHRLARRGLRVLAVATAPSAEGRTLTDIDDLPPLTLVGFVGLADPVRQSARVAVDTLRSAGVRPAMITGDHPTTAEAIAVELDMLDGRRVLTGAQMDELDDDALDRVIGDVAVFARVTPHQKVRIVASYQRIGRAVAMTGDGANDAAAIRLADAGIALGGRGTDAARGSADVVVVDDRLETIVDAVVEGRALWESVRAAVAILVGGNLGEIAFTLAGTALGGGAPLNARQLLLVNLLTDMAPALAIALREPRDRSPEALLHAGPDASLGTALTRDIVVRAGSTAAGATSAWAVARLTGTPTRARTVGLAALVGTQLAQTLVAGGLSPSVVAATGVSVGALVVAIQTPGVSRFFGCRPLGPIGWSTAIAATAGATAVSVVLPRLVEPLGERAASLVADAGGRPGGLRMPDGEPIERDPLAAGTLERLRTAPAALEPGPVPHGALPG